MSDRSPFRLTKILRLAALARASLYALYVLGLGGLGCLVIDSPDFDTPRPTVPWLRAVNPNTFKTQTERPVDALQPHRLTFEILSEDLNQTQNLQGALILDFPGFGVDYPDHLDHRLAPVSTIAPGHLVGSGAGPRLIETDPFRFDNTVPLGCHTVTLIVSHQFDTRQLIIQPAKSGDVATLTWWYLLVDATGKLPADAVGCYSEQPGVGDGGAEAGDGGPDALAVPQ